MSLNIKNERVHELVREAARRTGRSQTSAVEAALEAYLCDLDAVRDVREQRLRVLADFDRLLTDADLAAMTTDDLYDEAGMPPVIVGPSAVLAVLLGEPERDDYLEALRSTV